VRDLPQLRDLCLGKRRLLQEEGGDAIVADDGQMLRGVESARVAGRLRERYEAETVEDPARDREQTAIGEMVDVLAECFGGVERVLGQRVRASSRGSPRSLVIGSMCALRSAVKRSWPAINS